MPGAALPKLKDGVEDPDAPPVAPAPKRPPLGFAASPVEGVAAPPKRLPAGLDASPPVFPRPPNPANDGVEDAPVVVPPPPKRPPGLLAGVLEAPPPKTLVEPVAVFPVPNSELPEDAPGVLFAVPKSDGVVLPDEPVAAPNSGFAGALLPSALG